MHRSLTKITIVDNLAKNPISPTIRSWKFRKYFERFCESFGVSDKDATWKERGLRDEREYKRLYIRKGINMKSEQLVYTRRYLWCTVYVLSVYRSQSRGFRHSGETASILAAISTPLSGGTRKRIRAEILAGVSIIETHYSGA